MPATGAGPQALVTAITTFDNELTYALLANSTQPPGNKNPLPLPPGKSTSPPSSQGSSWNIPWWLTDGEQNQYLFFQNGPTTVLWLWQHEQNMYWNTQQPTNPGDGNAIPGVRGVQDLTCTISANSDGSLNLSLAP